MKHCYTTGGDEIPAELFQILKLDVDGKKNWLECFVCTSVHISHSYKTILKQSAASSLQSCPILCDPVDGSPPGSPVPGVLQASILEWVAISFSSA